MLPSGSLLPLPSKVTLSPAFTVWSEPALATGVWLGGGIYLSVTLTVFVLDAFLSSVIVRLNARSVSEDMLEGAVNVAISLSAPVKLTDGPAVCIHEYLIGSPSGSLLPLPSNETTYPAFTV